jgi:hypothetical protein
MSSQKGWIRLFSALSVGWLLVSASLYLSSLGDEYYSSEGRNYPTWHLLWAQNLPVLGNVSLYKAICPVDLDAFVRGRPRLCKDGFSPVGAAVFALSPVAVIWIIGLSALWVRRGFHEEAPKREA